MIKQSSFLLRSHRAIIFDRPGTGYSERPRGHLWTAAQRAELLHKALRQLGVERPVVVGHSWGTIVALALAKRHQADVAGLVLLSGCYFWTLRPDALLVVAGALSVLGLAALCRPRIVPAIKCQLCLQRKKWNPLRYYNDPSYYNDKNLVRPYRVGMSRGFCHVGPNPVNSPSDPENPKWENLSSLVGRSIYLRNMSCTAQ